MQDLFSPDALRAAAEFVIVLDQHRFGAAALLCLAGLVAVVALACRRSRPKQRKLRGSMAHTADHKKMATRESRVSGK